MKVVLQKRQGIESENYIQLSNHWYIQTLGYSSRSKQYRNTKIGTQSAKGLHYQRKAPSKSNNLYKWHKCFWLYLLSEYTFLSVGTAMELKEILGHLMTISEIFGTNQHHWIWPLL